MSTRHPVNATQALARLIAGNDRYIQGQPNHPNNNRARREATANGQAPFAVILTCADSRVPPELIFDQGVGDLFVIRVAGNILNRDVVLGSIEYALEHLGTNLVVVMGHQGCGAVSAAIADGGNNSPAIEEIVRAIRPVVQQARQYEGDLLDNTIRLNARSVTEALKTAKPIVHDLVEHQDVQIVSAYYTLDTGRVAFLDSEV